MKLVGYSIGSRLAKPGETIDLTVFWQGMQLFGANNYPLHYHIEKRMFFDQFASGFGNAGTSTADL